jgi:hypothetical protein
MLINMLDEPRILPDDGCNADCDISHDDNQALLWTDLSHRDIWNKITTSCHYNDGSRTTGPMSGNGDVREISFGLRGIYMNVVDLRDSTVDILVTREERNRHPVASARHLEHEFSGFTRRPSPTLHFVVVLESRHCLGVPCGDVDISCSAQYVPDMCGYVPYWSVRR